MDLKIISTLWMIFIINNILIYTKGEVTIGDLIKSLKDTQELLDAYNDRDYIKMGIKLIDIKLKIDPPPKGSRDEQLLLFLRRYLIKIYPDYYKIHQIYKTVTLEDIRNLKYEEIVELAINSLDEIIYRMGVRLDRLQHYERKNNNTKSPTSITDGNIEYSTRERLNIFNDTAREVLNAFPQAADRFSLRNRLGEFFSNHEIQQG